MQSARTSNDESNVSGERATTTRPAFVADLWFSWDGPQRNVEVVLVAVNGSIAGAFPTWVDQGERLPIHRKFLPATGRLAWCVRIAASGTAVEGLCVWVELRAHRSRSTTRTLCDGVAIAPRAVHTIQCEMMLPGEPSAG